MKSSSLFALLFLLFAFSIASSAKAQFVRDTGGNYVIDGGAYYILPYIWALGGGLGLAKTGNETCPFSVMQSHWGGDKGLPWTILPPLKSRFIPTNSNLDLFSVEGEVPGCVPLPSKWTIVEGEDGIKSVKISPSDFENTPLGRFQIQEHYSGGGAYKIVFCPTKGDGSCGDLGISRDNDGNRRLVITHDLPLILVFIKVESSQVSEG